MRKRKKYPCPCCRHNTLPEKAGGTYFICPVCFWEDDPLQHQNRELSGGANRVSLNEAQKNYEEFGACEKAMIIHVRSPLKSELRAINRKQKM
ncbi:MAG: hydrolase [Bacteroidetes bacterium]|nr:hydrolase [Bacteroidota bacterium]